MKIYCLRERVKNGKYKVKLMCEPWAINTDSRDESFAAEVRGIFHNKHVCRGRD